MKLGVAGIFVSCVACSLPNLGAVQDINLSGCMTKCKVEVDACFDKVSLRVDFCQSIEDGDTTAQTRSECIYGTGVYKGSTSVIKMTQACIVTDQSCIAACTKETEDKLKSIK